MPKSTKKPSNPTNKGRGRQSDFSGEKEVFLDNLGKDFQNLKDRGALYNQATQGFIEKFGYSRDGKVFVEADTLSPEEKLEYYQSLRGKLAQWFRHRNLAKTPDRSYVAEIVNSIKSAASVQPRKRSTLTIYTEKNKDKINSEFAILWSAVQKDLSPKKRLPKYNEFAQTCWKKESQSYRDEIEKEALMEHEKANQEWKEKLETFNGTPEEFEKAWGMAESVLPSFADGFAEWLGAQVIIIAVLPKPLNGEITMQFVQSDSSKGQTKSLLPEFDKNGWKIVQEMVINYGKAYFSAEECKRRIVKREDDDSIGDLGEEHGAMVGTVGLEDGADGKIDHGDSEGKIQKDAHSPVDGQVSDKEEVCEIRVHEADTPADKSTADYPNTPCPELSGEIQLPDTLSTQSLTAPNKEMNGETLSSNHLSSTAQVNGEKTTLVASHPSPQPVPGSGPPGFSFPGEMNVRGSPTQEASSLDAYSGDFGWSALPSDSASHTSGDLFFGNREIHSGEIHSGEIHSGLRFSKDTRGFPKGSFLNELYEPLDASLDPSIPFTSPEPNMEIPGHSVTTPTNPYTFQGTNLHPSFPFISPGAIPPAGNSLTNPTNPYCFQGTNLEIAATSAGVNFNFPPQSDDGSNRLFEERGEKRKGDEAAAIVTKKRCLKGAENRNVEAVSDSMVGSEEVSGELKERAGKPTLSGRVPLMPAHLAEGGYQGEKKGVRGRKPSTKKPKSKGFSAKPSSKGVAKIPGRKKGLSKQ